MAAMNRGLAELSHAVKTMAKAQAEMQLEVALIARRVEALSEAAAATAQQSTRDGGSSQPASPQQQQRTSLLKVQATPPRPSLS